MGPWGLKSEWLAHISGVTRDDSQIAMLHQRNGKNGLTNIEIEHENDPNSHKMLRIKLFDHILTRSIGFERKLFS